MKSIVLAIVVAVMFFQADDETLRQQGMMITDTVQSVLLANVKTAMAAGGPANAVAYCNVKAMPLTDSLSALYRVNIRRTSLKHRSAANAPSMHEERVLRRFEFAVGKNQLPPSVLETINDTLHFYRPIIVAKPCLVCHGEPGVDITQETLSVLNTAYPNDLATGYKEGDLRGMWHLVFGN